MKYKGKLYGRLSHDVYVPLEETTEDYDLLKDRLQKVEEDRSNFIALVERLSDILEDNKDKRFTADEMRMAMLFSKNHDGYPKILKIGDIGVVKTVELNHVIVDFSPTYGRWIDSSKLINPRIKLPKKLLVEKVYLRDLKLRKILG